MRIRSGVFLLAAVVLLCGCSSENKSGLEGVWELDSGEFTTPDTSITFPGSSTFLSYKFFGKTRYSSLTQDAGTGLTAISCGTFTLKDGSYTENIEIADKPENIGSSVTFRYEIKDGFFTITRIETDNGGKQTLKHKEIWKKIE